MGKVAVTSKKTITPTTKKTKKTNSKAKTVKKEPVIETKKVGKRLEKKPETKDVEIRLVNENIDLCNLTAKPRRLTFITYYLTPGQPCYHNGYRSAIKAGYAESTASVKTYEMLHDPEIARVIKANDKITQMAIHEAALRAIEIKKKRAFFNPLDYFTIGTTETKYGEKQSVKLKPMEEMTEEQLMCVDGTDLKGQASIPIYALPDREKELDDILKMDAEQQKIMNNNDEEETREIILERITIRENKRRERPTGWESEIIDPPENEYV